jgi:hypothetical protein
MLSELGYYQLAGSTVVYSCFNFILHALEKMTSIHLSPTRLTLSLCVKKERKKRVCMKGRGG